MAQTAQDILNAINGVTFGQGTLADAYEAPTSYGTNYHNAAGGTEDVYTGSTSAATGYVKVAYVDHFAGYDAVANANGAGLGAAGKITGVHYAYTAANGNNFATFGYITISNQFNIHSPTLKYYIHGFSQYGILLSPSATLTVDDVNGHTTNSNQTFSQGGTFEILSTHDLGAGPTSPGAAANLPPPSVSTFSSYFYDGAGLAHSAYNYNGKGNPSHQYTNVAYDGNTKPPTFPLVFTSNAATFDIASVPCFAEGTRILTLRGEVAVEDLVEGDVAVTASGATRPVIWIGSRQVRPMSHPVPDELNPVRVRRGAFGEGAPSRDLVLSPGHAVFVDGVLVPVGKLVNGATIVQEEVDSVRYFHVELDAHDVLLAEGLACESYLDDGNRDSFANSPEHTALHGRLDPVDWERACAPVVRGGEALARLQARLHARAEAMGWVRSTDHGLTLIADGAELAPVHATAQRLWFSVPACAELVLASAAGRPLELVPGALDPRRLGVAVAGLRLDGEPLDLAAETFGPGFHALEQDGAGAWRWTDGEARLTLHLVRPAMVEITLRAAAYAWRRPAPTLRLVTTG